MKVGFVGCGEMGEPMAGHVLKSGKFEVWVFDIRKAASKAIARRGAKVAGSLEELGRQCDVIVVMVGYDHQVRQVVTDLARIGKKGAVIVITATTHPDVRRISSASSLIRLSLEMCFESRMPLSAQDSTTPWFT